MLSSTIQVFESNWLPGTLHDLTLSLFLPQICLRLDIHFTGLLLHPMLQLLQGFFRELPCVYLGY